MNKFNRRQFIKTCSAAGLAGLAAPSFVLSAFTSTKGSIPLTVGDVKVLLRIVHWNNSKITTANEVEKVIATSLTAKNRNVITLPERMLKAFP